MLITLVAGARPNFMKIAPIIKAIQQEKDNNRNIEFRLVHTGQHYDKKMSHDFFEQLDIPEPDMNLECRGGTQAEQTAAIMIAFEKELMKNRPDLVLVVGDVTSTMACTIAAKKLNIDVVHVEAGIRSGDMTMPEEINRIVTDSLCNHFFTTSKFANTNLEEINIAKDRIHFVGNTMIDTLYQNISKLRKPSFWDASDLTEQSYFLITLHRPSNVDDIKKLQTVLKEIESATDDIKIVFPVHPRTQALMNKIEMNTDKFILVAPLGYLEFIFLVKNAKAIITDSGGITEEATVLQVPCLTLRNTTERPETVTIGTNELIGDDFVKLRTCTRKIINGNWKNGMIPDLWDGHAASRIVKKLLEVY